MKGEIYLLANKISAVLTGDLLKPSIVLHFETKDGLLVTVHAKELRIERDDVRNRR